MSATIVRLPSMRVILLLCLLALGGCSLRQPWVAPPQLNPLRPMVAPPNCGEFFPKGDWQYVHAMDFYLPKQHSGSAIGIVVLQQGEIRCALTTVEGFTLFEARVQPGAPVRVSRAAPPFDKKDFAEKLLNDVRLLFVAPAGSLQQGQLSDGVRVCRYVDPEGNVTDLLPGADGCWRLNTYRREAKENRIVAASSCEWSEQSGLMPARLELTAPGPQGYSLKLRLITAEHLNPF